MVGQTLSLLETLATVGAVIGRRGSAAAAGVILGVGFEMGRQYGLLGEGGRAYGAYEGANTCSRRKYEVQIFHRVAASMELATRHTYENC